MTEFLHILNTILGAYALYLLFCVAFDFLFIRGITRAIGAVFLAILLLLIQFYIVGALFVIKDPEESFQIEQTVSYRAFILVELVILIFSCRWISNEIKKL